MRNRFTQAACRLGPVDRRRVSRRLSYVLRHAPDSVGVDMDEAGWVRVDDLLEGLRRHRLALTHEQLAEIVATSDKQRFAFDPSGERIRANQGHSVPIDLGLTAQPPPPVLFHGTVPSALPTIRAQGLIPRGRHHVHLSVDVDTARAVGGRRGRPVILRVDAAAMADDGAVFYCSANGVWLIDAVPPEYLSQA